MRRCDVACHEAYRSVLGAVAWAVLTRAELAVYVQALQRRAHAPRVADCKRLNLVIRYMKKYKCGLKLVCLKHHLKLVGIPFPFDYFALISLNNTRVAERLIQKYLPYLGTSSNFGFTNIKKYTGTDAPPVESGMPPVESGDIRTDEQKVDDPEKCPPELNHQLLLV